MGHTNLNKFVRRFKRVLSPDALNNLGRTVRLCHRERVITPYRLALSCLASCATMRVETFADIQRTFNALFHTSVAYKPFHNQLAKCQFGEFMRELVESMLEHWVVRVLRIDDKAPFGEFSRIIIQDGSSFALKDALSSLYPGRFKSKGPSAVELHVSMDLLEESLTQVVLTPDTFTERAELPAPETLRGALLLADRGYFDVKYLNELDIHGAHFVIRGFISINPTVLAGYREDGTQMRGVADKKLQQLRCPKRKMLDLDVAWGSGERLVRVRLIVSWNATKKEYRYLVTNLARDRYSIAQITQAYRLRWQIELLFKEWKSYANLHAFDTRNPSIAEGMIWAAIGAALLKRLLAHTTQLIKGVAISTRKVAMCAHHVLDKLFSVLASEHTRGLSRAFEVALEYLAINAQRAHPKRDRRSGRSQLGLQPIISCA
jgi:hypothetical protein